MSFPRLDQQGNPIKTALESLPEGERLHADYIDGLEGLGYTGSKGTVGFTGSAGAGYTGSAGADGAAGYTGSRGAAGAAGYTGSKGADGNDGAQGYSGSRGATGYAGSKGAAGNLGFTGSKGAIGYSGSRGVSGYAGSRGQRGFTGSKGYTGSRGVQGVTGFVGSRGQRGFSGSIGALGYTGSQGAGFTGSRGVRGFTGSRGFVGSRGLRGYTGSVGNIGFTGSRGLVGGTGYTGSKGGLGYAGSRGFTGSKGTTGFTGSKGNLGYTGSAGTDGTNGYNGSRGYTGSRGATGYAGSKGTIGFTGSKGAIGYTGSKGITGFVGSRGATGHTGSRGFSGSRGYTGSKGAIGFTGSKGEQGDAGNLGFTGSRGYNGSQGYTGSRGATGFTGSQGAFGYSGSRGFTGSIGYTGSRGATGFVGSTGATGALGYTGSTGAGYVGSQGIPGELGFTGSRGAGWTGSQGITGWTGSLGWQGYTGSAGAGFTGSQGIQGPLGYTGSQGPVGPVAMELNIVGHLETANSLPETGSYGETYTIGDSDFASWDGDEWVQWTYRGVQGYAGSMGLQGVPGIRPNFLGYLESELELPDANSSVEDDAYIIDTELFVYNNDIWVNWGPFQGPTGAAGAVGYVGSQGAPAIGLTVIGTSDDIGDLPDANTTVDGDAFVIAPDLYVSLGGAWENMGGFVGYTGSYGYTGSAGYTGSIGATGWTGSKGTTGNIGYTGSAGVAWLANTAAGANGSIQFNSNNVLTGSANLTIIGTNLQTIAGNTAMNLAVGGVNKLLANTTAIQANVGLNFGSVLGASNTDLTKHIDLYGGTFGLGITSSALNYVSPSVGTHYFRVGTTTPLTANSTVVQAPLGLLSLGSVVSAAANDIVTAGLQLFGTSYGLNVTSGEGINIVHPTARSVRFVDLTSNVPYMTANNTTFQIANTTMNISFTNRVAATANNLDRHIALYGTTYGFNVTGGRLGIVVNTNANVCITTSTDSVNHFTFDTALDQLSVPVGSNTAPSYTFNGDLDLGMYRISSNILGFAAAGQEIGRMQAGYFIHTDPDGRFRAGINPTAASPAYCFQGGTGGTTMGMYYRAANQLGLASGGIEGMFLDTNGYPYFPAAQVIAASGGAAYLSGGSNQLIRASSSARYKQDIQELTLAEATAFVVGAEAVTFRSALPYEDQTNRWLGVIAEQIAEVEPRLVIYEYLKTDLDESGEPVADAVKVPESVDYARMVVPLLKVVQDLMAKNAALEARVAALES